MSYLKVSRILASLLFWSLPFGVSAFSADHVEMSRSRLAQAFSSPSGKLTFCPEIVIPEPRDPTAILLQTNAIQGISQKLRRCKTNAVFVRGSITALQTFVNEQETARGGFPGPVPVIYCGDDFTAERIEEIARAGAEGVLIKVCDENEIASPDDISSDASWKELCDTAVKIGLQPVLEVFINEEASKSWVSEDIGELVRNLCDQTAEPVSIVITVNSADEEKDREPKELPSIPKEIGKKIPIIGSVRITAGDSRLSQETQRFKASGFTGAFLRSECLPGFSVTLNLEAVGAFWSHCIEDLKSTRSKSFSFRSKNNMDKSVATKWANYQHSVLQSGALGDPEDSYSIVDEASGEYKGFV